MPVLGVAAACIILGLLGVAYELASEPEPQVQIIKPAPERETLEQFCGRRYP